MYLANFSENISVSADQLHTTTFKAQVRKCNLVVCDPVCTLTIDIPSPARLHGMFRLITLYYDSYYPPKGRMKLLAVISIAN